NGQAKGSLALRGVRTTESTLRGYTVRNSPRRCSGGADSCPSPLRPRECVSRDRVCEITLATNGAQPLWYHACPCSAPASPPANPPQDRPSPITTRPSLVPLPVGGGPANHRAHPFPRDPSL